MNSAAAGQVCIIGSLNIDTTLRVTRLPGAGETVLARDRHISPGGKGANQAAAAAALGSRVRFVGAVGADAHGEHGLAALQARGIDTSGTLRVKGTPTGTAVILVSDDGENLIVVDPGANADLDEEWVSRTVRSGSEEVLLAQLEVPVPTLLAAARSRTLRRFILNPAPMPDLDTLMPLLQHVDVLVPNRAELGQLAGRPTPTSMEQVQDCVFHLAFQGTLVVTLGADGAAIFDPTGALVEWVSAPPVDVVDTSGAGDAFCGALAHELAQPGTDVASAVHRAVDLAATSTQHVGAQVSPAFGSVAR